MLTAQNTRTHAALLFVALLGTTLGLATPPANGGLNYDLPQDSRVAVRLTSRLRVGVGPSTKFDDFIGTYYTGMNNITSGVQSVHNGILRSSMNQGNSYAIRRRSSGPPPAAFISGRPTVDKRTASSSTRVYESYQPKRISSTGMGNQGISLPPSFIVSLGETRGKVESEKPEGLPANSITSLVPERRWEYAEPLAAGEEAFRKGDYKKALTHFSQADKVSPKTPEVLLSITHAHLALAKGDYSQAAKNLAATIEAFPYLPVVDVHPKDFFGDPKGYDQALTALEQALKANPKDANAALLLGYIRLRDRLLPVARTLLATAEKQTKDPAISNAAELLLKFVGPKGEGAEELQAKEPPLDTPVEFATAGITIALPKGYTLEPITHIHQVFSASRGAQGTDKPRSITLSAHAVDKGVTTHKALNTVMKAMEADLAIDDLVQLEELEVDYKGTKALARVYVCRYMNQRVILARLCFIRKLANERLAYVAGMGVLESDAAALLPTFSAVMRSLTLSKLQAPTATSKPAKMDKIIIEKLGFSLECPLTWIGQATSDGYELSAVDWTLGGKIALQVEASMKPLATTDKADIKTLGEQFIAVLRKQGLAIDILEQGPTELAGHKGHQFLIGRTVTNKAGKTLNILALARLIAIPDKDGARKLYALVVRSRDMDDSTPKAAMEAFAKRFTLLKAK